MSNVEIGIGRTSHTLTWFFTRPLAFEGETLEAISAFLNTCRYVSDELQFEQRDWWMHPAEFEEQQQGDCEDHAVWAWRVLHELGHDVRLMIGTLDGTGHAWVQLYHETSSEILEATAKRNVPLSQASGYLPEHSIKRQNDGSFILYAHEPLVMDRIRGIPSEALSEPHDWYDIDRLIFEGKKSEAHEAIKKALNGKGSHTREFLDRYEYLRAYFPDAFEVDDQTYWADW